MTAARFFGWRVVAGAGLYATCGWGLGFYGPPVYLHAVVEQRGWSVALVSTAVTLHFLFSAVAVANLPAAYRRFGVARVAQAAVLLSAVGVTGWAVAAEPWHLFLATVFSGVGWAGMGGAAINAIVAPWFVRARPAALSSAYNGASLGGVVFSPLWVAAIAVLGFPLAAAVIGAAIAIVVCVLAERLFKRTPQEMALRPDGDAPGATRAA